MAASISLAAVISRIAVVFLVTLALFLFHDKYWPSRDAAQAPDDFDDMSIIEPYIPSVPALTSFGVQWTAPKEVVHHSASAMISTPTAQSDIPQSSPKWEAGHSCTSAPGADSVMVLVKTSLTELYQMLPMRLLTTLECVRHLQIFSDFEGTLGDYQVFDALANVREKYREFQPEFARYRKLRQYQHDGEDLNQLGGDTNSNLDKWKFLPALHTAFTTASEEIEWFVFIDANTSLCWTNLLQWLNTMDPTEPLYLGEENVLGTTAFAHAGSGIVISRKAADMLAGMREGEGRELYDARWEEDVAGSCCGDEVVARAFVEAGVQLTPAWPLLQSEPIASLDWTDDHWCSSLVTWHDVSAVDLDAMWRFERAWVDGHGWDEPYIFRDIFAHFIEKHIRVNRTNWDNLSQDRQLLNETLAADGEQLLYDFDREAVESRDGCAAACLHPMYEDCIQWKYSLGRCYLGNTIRFGQADEREEDSWTSGWIQERIENLKERHLGCRVRWAGMEN